MYMYSHFYIYVLQSHYNKNDFDRFSVGELPQFHVSKLKNYNYHYVLVEIRPIVKVTFL